MIDGYRQGQAWAIGELSLAQLISAGRRIARGDLKTLRLAVLGEAATQHYCMALSAALKLRGWWPEIYEAEYDTIRQEVLDPNSQLYAHKPEVVVFFPATQLLWSRYCSAPDKVDFAETVTREWSEIRDVVRDRLGALIIQHNFVVPLDRPFGNASSTISDTFVGAVMRQNAALAEAANRGDLLLVDTEFQAAYHGKRHWLDERLWCHAKQALSPTYLPHLVKEVSDVILTRQGVVTKCVVLDLDNTLWGGILSDDGPHLLEMGQTELGLAYRRFQLGLAQLKARGILLAICSKNHQSDVLAVLDTHPDMVLRRDDFAAVVANFGDKVSNLMEIRQRLNIGFDSFVFLDDSPFERDLVRKSLPLIQVPELPEDPASFLSDIARWNLFEGLPPTSEDIARAAYYRADAAREEVRARFAGLDDYMADLDMKADILSLDDYTLPRASQLVMRSNQFNLTTIRYSDAELKEIAKDPGASAFCIRLADRLGDNGIIAFVIVRKVGLDAIVDSWIMSCRVLGRRVEELTVQMIVERALKLGCKRVVGRYSQTAKNGMVASLFLQQGFEPAGSEGHMQLFTMTLGDYRAPSFPIVVNHRQFEDAP